MKFDVCLDRKLWKAFFFSGGMNSSFKNGLGQLGFLFFLFSQSSKAGSARYWRCDQ